MLDVSINSTNHKQVKYVYLRTYLGKIVLPKKLLKLPRPVDFVGFNRHENYKLEIENVFEDALFITEPKMCLSFNTIKMLLFFAKMTQPIMRG